MKKMMAEKNYLQPKSIHDACALAAAYEGDFRFLAGGTDLMVNRFQENETSSCLIDLNDINELKQISIKDNCLSIGALTALDELKNHTVIIKEFPVLIEAAHAVGSPVVRKSATLGGNILCENRCIFYNQSKWWRDAVGNCLKCDGTICIATGSKKHCYSEFVSDTAVALISMNAMIEVIDREGHRTMMLENIYTGDGVQPVNLNRTTLVTSILLPLTEQFHSVFNKLRRRESMDFTSLTTAVTINKSGELNTVLGGVDPKPILIKGNRESNREELINQAIKKSRAIDNEMFSRKYRRQMIRVFLQNSYQQLETPNSLNHTC
jgi:4-hydroxybenzoyl-CoA reductase subunit beta